MKSDVSDVKLDVEKVAPLVGAWIEINVVDTDLYDRTESLPSWERGLKSYYYNINIAK